MSSHAMTGPSGPRSNPVRATARMAAGAASIALLGGCNRSPSQDILGSFFPSWMLCLGLGLLAAVLCRLAVNAAGWRDDVPWPLLTYLAFAFAVTCLIWLIWFGH